MLRKGDRVEWTNKTKDGSFETKYGVVTKGGSFSATVIYDGGEYQVKGPVSLFRLSSHPLPTDAPSVMDKWGVKRYKEIPGHGDSATFHAYITLKGKKVLEAMNDGWGGPNSYHGGRAIENQLEEDAKEWGKQFGCTHLNEMTSLWIDWYVNRRPFGVTAAQEMAEFEQIMSSY